LFKTFIGLEKIVFRLAWQKCCQFLFDFQLLQRISRTVPLTILYRNTINQYTRIAGKNRNNLNQYLGGKSRNAYIARNARRMCAINSLARRGFTTGKTAIQSYACRNGIDE